MAATQRPIVDASGNIAVHGRAGAVIVVKIEAADDDTFENIAALPLFFEVSGKYRLELGAGATDYSRQIEITREQIADLALSNPAPFVLLDENPEYPRALWAGVISAFGFRAQPPGAPDVPGTAITPSSATVIVQSPGTDDPVVVIRYESPAFAAAVSYDNSYSGIPATNVQAAIDFLAGPAYGDGMLDFSKRANSALIAVI